MPRIEIVFATLASVRLLSALFASHVADCDEVFNYWEPLHFLMFGYGLQTWEYVPTFAIRSYAYLAQYLPITLASTWFHASDKRVPFYALRIFFSLLSALADTKLYGVVAQSTNRHVARYFWLFSLFGTGNWSASTAFLPSTFAMHWTNLAMSNVMTPTTEQNKTLKATTCFAIAAIYGWPFAILLAIPFVLEELFASNTPTVSGLLRLVRAGLCSAVIAIPMVLIDSYMYKKPVFVTWNIIRYNVFSNNATLYGIEPWYFFITNGVLNFNIVLFLALSSFPLFLVSFSSTRRTMHTRPASLGLRLLPFYIWFLILSAQPHKEERFLFPAYGLLCFNGSLALYLLLQLMPMRILRRMLLIAVITTYVTLCISRVLALQKYYAGPVHVLDALWEDHAPTGSAPKNDSLDTPDMLCYGAEWYRFPSHFFAPAHIRLAFVDFGFKGILPALYLEGDTALSNVTSVARANYNDLNQEERDRYIDPEQCSYFVSLESSAHDKHVAPILAKMERVNCIPFLDAANSHRITRLLYIPFSIWQERNAFDNYCLYRKVG